MNGKTGNDLNTVEMNLRQVEDWIVGLIRRALREERNQASGDDKLLTAKQAAKLLEFKSVRRVYELTRENKLPAKRISKNTLRYRHSDIQRFIASGAK